MKSMSHPPVEARLPYLRRTTLADAQTLGPRLRELREAKGSLRDVSAATGVTISTISRFERGYDICISSVLELLTYLGCSVAGPDGDEV